VGRPIFNIWWRDRVQIWWRQAFAFVSAWQKHAE